MPFLHGSYALVIILMIQEVLKANNFGIGASSLAVKRFGLRVGSLFFDPTVDINSMVLPVLELLV